jgi:hypothetical protein
MAAFAFALGAFLTMEVGPAEAAQRSPTGTQVASAELTKLPEAVSETTGSTTGAKAAEEDAGCHRARKRLWVDGEGWIVRRVTTCR